MNLSTKVARNGIIQVINKIISTILGLATIGLLARYLGPSGFGDYTIIVTFASLFSIVADFGMVMVATQMINKPKVDQDKVLGNLLGWRLLTATIVIGLAPLAVLFFPYAADLKAGVAIMSLAYLALALQQIFVSLFQKYLRTEKIAIGEVVMRLTLLIGIAASIYLRADLLILIWMFALANLVGLIVLMIFSRRYARLSLRADGELWREIWQRSWPLLLITVTNLVYLKADVIILSLVKQSEAVGYYGAAYKVLDVLVSLPYMFAGIILPILVFRREAGDQAGFNRVGQRFFDLIAILALPLLIGGGLLAQPIMVLVAGRDFAVSGAILAILLIAMAAVFGHCVFTHLIIAGNRQKSLIVYYLIAAVTSLPLYWWLINKFSFYGAAVVTCYSEIFILIAVAILSRKLVGFRPRLIVAGKALAAALIMGLGLLIIRNYTLVSVWYLALAMIIAVVVYFGFLYWFKGFEKKDYEKFIIDKFRQR